LITETTGAGHDRGRRLSHITFRTVDLPRRNQGSPGGDRDALIKARQSVAGRFGFILGCVAAVAAATINLYRAPRPFSLASVALAVLMAALNIPFGIALGLLGERITRPPQR
jgi:hypothetical protein